MQHRIVVLGAGYAGAAAGYLARRLHPADFEITAGTGIQLRPARVDAVDGLSL